ncbi:MAG: cytochrome c [Gemmatimonadetes bacterium]|nr:cytochrome c [Gemmatimonadota bacterium]
MALTATVAMRGAPAADQAGVANFVEPDFPFIVSTLDARQLGPAFSPNNVAIRGVILPLGNGAYAAFDPDLLRMAVGWQSDSLEMTTMAQVSYKEPTNKNNQIPKVRGTPMFTTGLYAGWSAAAPDFRDPRPVGPHPEDAGRGPIPPELGRWSGVYVVGDRAVLSYEVGGTQIFEQPGSIKVNEEVGIVRAFRTGPVTRPLTLVAAEVGAARSWSVQGTTAVFQQGPAGDTLTAVALVGAPRGSRLQVLENRYVTVELPSRAASTPFRVVTWRGAAAGRPAFDRMLRGGTRFVAFERGGPAHWPETVTTRGLISPDTAAYVVDRIAIPLSNPWRRNVRVSDVDFFGDGRAAVVTFDGDVWIVRGIDQSLERVVWKRFSSGLFEPMSIQVVDDQIYVYGRDGVVRLRDLNGDEEADFYENFSNLVHTSIESREFPLSMDERPGGGFYLSKGGALNNGPVTAPAIAPGFRAGSRHSGSILEVSADGRSLSVFATGLREPFIGAHPTRGLVTSSDQQGNFVPSTPLYLVERGGYYGVAPTAHRTPIPEEGAPLVWLPHAVDRSGAGQAWVTGDRMGFGGDALVHFSYGRPGAFRVYADSTAGRVQGAVVSLLRGTQAPILKGQYNPLDGHLYLTGFRIWDSNATEVTAIDRLRYTGRPSTIPLAVQGGAQGILLRFATALDPVASDPARFQLQRWNYRRSSAYGSGNFRVDGSPGRDTLTIAAAHLSPDRRSLLLLVPDVREVMQMQLSYDVRLADQRPVTDTLYMTLHRVAEMDLTAAGFGGLDWRRSIADGARTRRTAVAIAASAAAGAAVYQRAGCAGCHSIDGTTEGKMGPTFRGLFGSRRTFTDGSSRIADAAYLRQSIHQPGSQIVAGYAEGMPSYTGILNDTETESLVLYLASLRGANAP